MKRTAALTRKTPLRRSSSPLARSCPLPPVSTRRKPLEAVRRRVVAGMRATTGGCARCGRRDVPVHGHERLGRSQGGDPTRPDCLLCVGCNGWCEDNPQSAAYTGWKVSRKYDPAPVLTDGQALALDGTVVTFKEAAA